MKQNRGKTGNRSFDGVASFIDDFPLSGHSAQKGQVVYATSVGIFYQRGGDPASHFGGTGPLISTTVFEGLVDMGVNIASLPSVAKSWKIAPDWSYIDFDLNQGIKFTTAILSRPRM